MEETKQPEPKQLEPLLAVYPDGTLKVGNGYTIGDILQALKLAEQQVLGIVVNRGQA